MWSAAPVTFVNALVIGPDDERYSSVRVRGGLIERLDERPLRGDAVIDLDGAIVFPGLINGHDHLELNSFRRLKWRPRYDNVREWIADFQPRFASDPELALARIETLEERLWVGGLKNLLSGVTTVCHHNPVHKPLRRRFPVRVVRRFGLSHSLHIDGARVAEAQQATPAGWPWIIHAAEGIDEAAQAEVPTLGAMGCLRPNTVLVHGVAMTPSQIEAVLGAGASLVWCPTSNDFLFARTASVARFAECGRLSLGTDSRLSGEGDLLDELRAAHARAQVLPRRLFQAVSSDAATVLRLAAAGRIERGAPADLTVMSRLTDDPFDTLVSASRGAVRLTMIDGKPLVSDDRLRAVFDARSEPAARIRVDGDLRHVSSWIAARVAAMTLAEPGVHVES